MITIKTTCWFTKLPDHHLMIGTSRGRPRGLQAGYRVYRKLAPGPWFHSVGVQEYHHLYRTEILDRLNPLAVAAELIEMGDGRVPCLACFERAGGPGWCHRALVAEWLAKATGNPVPEVGYEHLSQRDHPLMADELRGVVRQAGLSF